MNPSFYSSLISSFLKLRTSGSESELSLSSFLTSSACFSAYLGLYCRRSFWSSPSLRSRFPLYSPLPPRLLLQFLFLQSPPFPSAAFCSLASGWTKGVACSSTATFGASSTFSAATTGAGASTLGSGTETTATGVSTTTGVGTGSSLATSLTGSGLTSTFSSRTSLTIFSSLLTMGAMGVFPCSSTQAVSDFWSFLSFAKSLREEERAATLSLTVGQDLSLCSRARQREASLSPSGILAPEWKRAMARARMSSSLS